MLLRPEAGPTKKREKFQPIWDPATVPLHDWRAKLTFKENSLIDLWDWRVRLSAVERRPLTAHAVLFCLGRN